jgi:gliding motility-associated-like protein
VDIPNSNTLQLAIVPPLTGSTRTYRYRLLGAESTNINSPNCRVVSNLLYLTSLYFPVPDLSFAEDVCNPLQVQFSSIVPPGANYDWLIDGTAYTGNQNPIHTFGQFGSYSVKLKLSYPVGCSDSVTKNIPIQITPANIIVTPDTTICIGKSLTLTTLPALDFCWSPVTYLDNPALADPITTPPVVTKYYFTAKMLGANLVTNGDFSDGNTGFTSDYRYSGSGASGSVYFVGTNPATWDPQMPSCKDHTSGSGNMLLVSGSQQPGARIWTETLHVQPNTNYAFSAWLESINTVSPATLQFFINGVPLGDLLQAGATTCSWASFYTTWDSGSQTTAVISLVDQDQDNTGNDLALDDLSFAAVSIQIDSVTVSVETPLVTASPNTTVCRGSPVQLQASGAAGYGYAWSPGATLSDSTIANPIGKPADTTSYIVTGTSSRGCVTKDTIMIATFPYTAAILTPDTTICLGDPAQLQSKGASSYAWSPTQFLDNPGIANPMARPDKKTRFFLTATDANHCNEIDSVTISIRPVPVFQAPDGKIVCEGYSVMLGNKNASQYEYTWSPANSLNDSYSPTPLADPSSSTIYTVRISDSVCNNYDSLFSVPVKVNPNPVVVAKKANDIDCAVATAQLSVGGAFTYTWSPVEGLSDPRSTNPLASIDSTTTFIVRGTDVNGCFAFDTVTVNVTAAGKNLFVVPNAFSPNGDGHNDCFGIRPWGDVTIEEFSVYNRSGERVFTTRDPAQCWDGNFKGKPQQAGPYPYVIKARSFCGEIMRTGLVMLVR